ncbi:hypothetical protein AOZ06_14375 [Kibdelosporangium phytohabitans]|uniref:Uncharacterized protein n=1 Tax=Kibdelosporangium phytohabitans TaxID=860235 RepID=A0A0N9HWZ0_9PSEU|nr:hypothetical protein AOZ06_14375 [Kibdelosporangium phytohabitans]
MVRVGLDGQVDRDASHDAIPAQERGKGKQTSRLSSIRVRESADEFSPCFLDGPPDTRHLRVQAPVTNTDVLQRDCQVDQPILLQRPLPIPYPLDQVIEQLLSNGLILFLGKSGLDLLSPRGR